MLSEKTYLKRYASEKKFNFCNNILKHKLKHLRHSKLKKEYSYCSINLL